jgi:endonuclease/exonuclease/phosphatase family metal-dependent hydrolase
MVALLPLITGPWLCLCDFNLLHHPSEKNNSNFHQNLADAFNAMINSLALFELPLLDRRFTWSNGQDTPVLARLDRAFFNQDRNLAFPNSSLVSHHRPTSDHFPIVVTAATSIPSPVVFRFENTWLLDAAFLPTTIPAWSRPVPDRNAAA